MGVQLKNTGSALALQAVTMVVGLLLPRIMIGAFGSELNGLASSIAQFLSYATLIEGGIGGVIRAALYKAFAAKDKGQVDGILRASQQFFTKVAAIFLGYILVLAVIYPWFIDSTFDKLFTGSLVCIIAASTMAQYCLGITYSTLLQADQRNYISNLVQILTYVLNTLVAILLIQAKASFHMVKLASAAVFVLQPVILHIYARRKYHVDIHAQPQTQLLRQRWSGMAHHIAWFLHTNTDVVVITLLGSLKDVSVYSIYYMVAGSLTKLASALFNGSEAKYGKMLAAQGAEKTIPSFHKYVMLRSCAGIVLFTTAGAMLTSFIGLYTQGITDANYQVPLLGYMLLLAEGLYCLRIPYHGIVTAAGHFKRTQSSAILETVLNIVLSVVLILQMGMPGVAVATAAAMLYRTIYYLWYLSRNILMLSMLPQLLRLLGAVGISVGTVWLLQKLPIQPENYLQWALWACLCVAASCVAAAGFLLVFYRREAAAWVASLRKDGKPHGNNRQ